MIPNAPAIRMSSSGASVDPALPDRDGLVSRSPVSRGGEVGGPYALQAAPTSGTKDNNQHVRRSSESQCGTVQEGGYHTFRAGDTSTGTENRLNGKLGTLAWNHSTSSLVETSSIVSSEHATVNGRRTR